MRAPRALGHRLAALAVLLVLANLLLPPLIARADTSPAAAATIGDLAIEGAWTRQTPPRARAGGAYLTITNRGDAPDRLVGGEAAFAERVEIHAMSVADGVMRMTRLADGLEIAPGETVRLEPGGYHVMLIGLAPDALVEGETATIRLEFERAGRIEIALPVAPIGARSPGGMGMGGTGMGGTDHGAHGGATSEMDAHVPQADSAHAPQ